MADVSSICMVVTFSLTLEDGELVLSEPWVMVNMTAALTVTWTLVSSASLALCLKTYIEATGCQANPT
jgi:hypothetical protein